jgi:hypothetical protein
MQLTGIFVYYSKIRVVNICVNVGSEICKFLFMPKLFFACTRTRCNISFPGMSHALLFQYFILPT